MSDTLESLKKEAAEWKKQAAASTKALSDLQEKNVVLSAAGSRFHNCEGDVMPLLCAGRKTIDIGGGQSQIRYQLSPGSRPLPLNEALDAIAENSPHYCRPAPSASSVTTVNPGGVPKRSAMTLRQKTNYVAAHGVAGFQKLEA